MGDSSTRNGMREYAELCNDATGIHSMGEKSLKYGSSGLNDCVVVVLIFLIFSFSSHFHTLFLGFLPFSSPCELIGWVSAESSVGIHFFQFPKEGSWRAFSNRKCNYCSAFYRFWKVLAVRSSTLVRFVCLSSTHRS